MGLAELGPAPGETVKAPHGEFVVRGLGFEEILAIYMRHKGEASGLFERLVNGGDGKPALSLDQVSLIGGALLSSSPTIAYEIIAAAAGGLTDEAVAAVSTFGVAVQTDALDKIAALTFTREMPPKKLLEIVVRAAGGMAQAVTPLNGPAA